MAWFKIFQKNPNTNEIIEAACDVLPDPPPAGLAVGARIKVCAPGNWYEYDGEVWVFDRPATEEENKAMTMAPAEPE